jgi:hypothetical protein
MAVQTQIQTRRGTAATWTSTNPTLAAGEIGFESDTGKIKIGTGSTAWNALAYTASSTAVTYLYNATAAQTTFSGADANGLTLAYTVGAEQVYLNGVLQVRGSDYTATNGTSIVLASGALTSDVLNVIAYSAMTITDTYTQAQSDAKFFQTANAFLAGKNKIINGDFGIWQRGTTFNAAADGAYTADRYLIAYNGGGTRNITQQTFTPATAPVAGYEGQYFLRYDQTVAGSGATANRFAQRIEDVRTFAGQTATLSFWAKAASSTTLPSISAIQSFGSGGSGGVSTSVTTSIAVTTSWQRFTYTVSIPSISGKTLGAGSYLEIRFELPINSTFTFDIWGVQLEAGSIATPFQTATGTIAGELAACQRYYWRTTNVAAATYAFFGYGLGSSTTNVAYAINCPVIMRTVPTSVDGGNLATYRPGATTSISAVAIDGGVSTNQIAGINATTTGVTSGTFYQLAANNSTAAYLGFSAEL